MVIDLLSKMRNLVFEFEIRCTVCSTYLKSCSISQRLFQFIDINIMKEEIFDIDKSCIKNFILKQTFILVHIFEYNIL